MAKKVTLRKADINDAEMLLEWRNDPDTIKNSVTQDKVSFFGHLAWLHRTIQDPNIELYIAIDDLVPVGTIRLDYIANPDEWCVSITVSPIARNKGYGHKILQHAIDEHPDRDLVAFIKEANMPSRKLFKSCGFIFCNCAGSSEPVITYRRGKELPLTAV